MTTAAPQPLADRLRGGLLPGLLVIALLALLLVWTAPGQTRATRLELVGGFERLTPAELAAVAAPHLSARLPAVDLQALQRAVVALPWVARARVSRHWPDRVRIVFEERQPFARWNADALLDQQGRRFRPGRLPQDVALPRLDGESGREREVMSAYQGLAQALQATPFALAGLREDARGEWTADTRGGIQLRLGRESPDTRLPLLRGAAAAQLAPRLAEVAYVDLRYANGFAVGWRKPGTQPTGVPG